MTRGNDGPGTRPDGIIALMVWVAAAVLLVVVVMAVRVRQALGSRRVLVQLRDLMVAGHHQRVLDRELPAEPFAEEGRSLKVTSAVLTGRYQLALDLLDQSADDGRSVAGTSTAARLRAVSLLGLGRYAEVARMLGDEPPPGPMRRLRAQTAIEVGDDDLATTLLADAYADPLEEAGRLRLLGDLAIRRGRLEEGDRLVRTARATYAGSGAAGAQVDVALCSLHLAQARLAAGLPAEAVHHARAGIEGLAVRPDHAPGFAEGYAIAARVAAALGNGDEAGQHLAEAQQHASRCQSPPLDAELRRTAALVAVDLGDHEVARRLIWEAIGAHDRLGARPVVAELHAKLTELKG